MRRRRVQRSKARGRGVGRWRHWYAKVCGFAVQTRTQGQCFRIIPPRDQISKKCVYRIHVDDRQKRCMTCVYTQKHFHVDGPWVPSTGSWTTIHTWAHWGHSHTEFKSLQVPYSQSCRSLLDQRWNIIKKQKHVQIQQVELPWPNLSMFLHCIKHSFRALFLYLVNRVDNNSVVWLHRLFSASVLNDLDHFRASASEASHQLMNADWVASLISKLPSVRNMNCASCVTFTPLSSTRTSGVFFFF